MITRSYKQNRADVLALYEEFKAAFKKINKPVSDSISADANKINNEIFNLMVLGEAKSGKSTFINAFLGKEIVPMDVRQCTSAIIKIRRGEDFVLTARTAGGGSIKKSGENKIREFLKQNASMSDQYRDIPITYINNELLIKKRGNITAADINKAIDALKDDNVNHLESSEYKRLIEEYANKHKTQWDKIITEIEITYPLSDEMQGITLIDSPGVSARGHVGKITEDYIREANAIIFVKYLKGQALESASFNSLLDTSAKQDKDLMFLLFTGKSDLQGRDFERLRQQALEMYENKIPKEKILFVDSKVQLFLNKCLELGTEEKIDAFFDDLENDNNDFDSASKRWWKAKGNVEAFAEKMKELSNFNEAKAAIEKFARAAYYHHLVKFIDNMLQECRRYKSLFSQTLATVEEHAVDPKALEERIEEKEIEIAKIYTDIHDGIEDIENKYADNVYSEGIIDKEAKALAEEYKKELENFKSLPPSKITNDTFLALKNMTFDAINDTKKFRREIAERIVAECNLKLIQYLDDSTGVQADAYVPNFSDADFSAIEEQASKAADKVRIEPKSFGMREEKISYHDYREHVAIEIDGIERRLDGIISNMITNIVDYTKECMTMYKTQLVQHKSELEGELKKLLRDKESNEKILKDIEVLKNNIETVDTMNQNVDKLKGVISNYVE